MACELDTELTEYIGDNYLDEIIRWEECRGFSTVRNIDLVGSWRYVCYNEVLSGEYS